MTRTTRADAIEAAAEDMAARWAGGDRPLADDYFDRAPELWVQPDAALELIAEELALRDEHGVPTTADSLAERFPRWAAQVRALFDCQRVFGPGLAPPAFPAAGERLGEFVLEVELGRGAHGRVYRASQPALAGRRVVLKVAPDTGDEHLSLARLQHSNIVPLYSVHEFPDRRLRGLCLPYFGGATLADALPKLRGCAAGRDLLRAIDPAEPATPTWATLERLSIADAACWVAACLADALQYAHDRGLLHLDLKPSNVLIAADGTPMLLDFHLARPPLRAGDPSPAWLGGSAGYMAPEHVAAVVAVRDGLSVGVAVDGRADVYSLGVLLDALLTGAGAAASPGVADVIARCTAAHADARYPTAGAVAADLRRHLADLPLRGVRNRSLGERWAKWRRRRPWALTAGLIAAAVVAVGTGAALHVGRLTDGAREALRDGRAHASAGRFAEASEAFRRGEALAGGVPFRGGLRSELVDARRWADRATAADELHAFAERVRQAAAADELPPAHADAIRRQCRDVWAKRAGLAAALDGQPTRDRNDRWRADLLDVGVLSAQSATPDGHAAALATLAEAEQLLGPSVALDLEVARHARALGLHADADAAERRADARPRRGAWDHLTAGRARLAAGDVARAAAEFDAALALDPRAFWAHYFRGVCHLRRKEPTEAAAAFSACVALSPTSAWCAYNRGLAFAAAGRPAAARADFDRALHLDPTFAAARAALDRPNP